MLTINSVREVSSVWPAPIPLGFVWARDVSSSVHDNVCFFVTEQSFPSLPSARRSLAG